jgi:hypothetical protein
VLAAIAAALAVFVPGSAHADPIKIAVFDFELKDVSGGSGIVPRMPSTPGS